MEFRDFHHVPAGLLDFHHIFRYKISKISVFGCLYKGQSPPEVVFTVVNSSQIFLSFARAEEFQLTSQRLRTSSVTSLHKCLLISFFFSISLLVHLFIFFYACVRTMCGSRNGGWSLPCVMSD
jgi:hypothetical protein